MKTFDAASDVMPTNQAGVESGQAHRPFQKRTMLRWVLLLALGLLALPFYQGILQVGGTFLPHPETLFWPLLAVTLLSMAACWLVLRTFPAASPAARWVELGLILALGLAARAVFWGTPPLMSPDPYRYVWDAHLLAHGVSPYTTTPFDDALQSLRDQAIWPNVRYRHDPTIYPPGAQVLFLLIYLIKPLSIGALKAGLEVCDALVAVLTLLLLRRHRLDLRRVMVYWWSPIPILEFAFNQHLDVAVIVWTLASLLVFGMRWRGSRGVAGILMGMATLTKLYPALYAVVMVRRKRDWVFLAGLIGIVGLVYLAFWPFQAQSGGFLSTYAQQSAIDRGIGLVWITNLVNIFSKGEMQVLVAQGAALAAGSLLIGWLCWRKHLRQEAGVLAITILWIVFSTHLFTWYLAVLLPFLAFYLRVPTFRRGSATSRPCPDDLSGRFATPALGTWLFALLMPFTYVIFAPGFYHPLIFRAFFYVAFAVATLPLITRSGREALLGFFRSSAHPASPEPAPVASTEEYSYAIDQTQPTSGQPAR
jgi:hypothetical protein